MSSLNGLSGSWPGIGSARAAASPRHSARPGIAIELA
jgi:hypothetical protein